MAFPLSSQAAIVRIGPGGFTPQASTITFSEQPIGTSNPTYLVNTATLGTVGVDFAGTFVGQVEAPGGTLTTTTPTAPLTLDLTSGAAFITTDGANPTSPVLSGTPRFDGSIAVWFSTPVAAVGLDGGFFDGLNSTSIEA